MSVSQGGYNTVMDILASGCPAVIVPFAAGTESEQTMRARILAQRGFVHVLEEPRLSPEALARAIDAAAGGNRENRMDIDTSGAETTARLLGDLALRHATGTLRAGE